MDSSPGTWLADLCTPEGIPFVLGHALDMQALHGGRAKHDTIDAQNILPEIAKKIASKANRDGGAARFPDPAVQQRIAVDLAWIGHDEALLRDLEWAMVTTAKPHDAHTLYWLQTIPGMGKRLSLVLLYELHDSARCPRVQDFVSSGRLVKCAKEAAGQRYGTSGTKIGKPSPTWACSAAAVLWLRAHPAGQKSRVHLEHQHGTGKALPV